MKSSQTHAAKRPHLNDRLTKLFGQPCNKTTMTGGRSTEAEKRPATNSTISGKHFFEGPNDYGHGVGPMKGAGGRKSSTGEY